MIFETMILTYSRISRRPKKVMIVDPYCMEFPTKNRGSLPRWPCWPRGKPLVSRLGSHFWSQAGRILPLILVTTLFYKAVILQGEICCRSLLNFKGLSLWALVRGTGRSRTFFCTISVRRSKYCLKFSIDWGQLQIFRWPFHSCTVFETYLINSLRFSEA